MPFKKLQRTLKNAENGVVSYIIGDLHLQLKVLLNEALQVRTAFCQSFAATSTVSSRVQLGPEVLHIANLVFLCDYLIKDVDKELPRVRSHGEEVRLVSEHHLSEALLAMTLPLRHLVHFLVHALTLVQSALISAQTSIRLIEDALRAEPETAHGKLRLELRAYSHELRLALSHFG